MKKPAARRTAKRTAATAARRRVGHASPAKTRRELPPQVRKYLAFAMIILAALGGFVFVNMPVGIGLSVLAGVRIWLYLREERRQNTAA